MALGFTKAEVLTASIAATTIGAGAVLVGPALISASPPEAPAPVMPSDPALARSCEALRALFERSVDVLRVWSAEESGFDEALLWVGNTEDGANINRGEIALLTLNRALGTLSAYTCVHEDDDDALASEMGLVVENAPTDSAGDPCARVVRRSSISDAFAWSWRQTTGVEKAIIATGVEELRVTRVREAGPRNMWRVEVVWGAAHADTDTDLCSFVVGGDG